MIQLFSLLISFSENIVKFGTELFRWEKVHSELQFSMDNNHNIDLRTEEVRDILKKMPHWTIRWGITIIFSSVILLLVFSYLYRYPDMISSDVVISSVNPPARIMARSTGKITGFYISDGEKVKTGQALAVIENPASYNDIEKVRQYLGHLNIFNETFNLSDYHPCPDNLILGLVQPAFSAYIKLISDYRNFISQPFYIQRISALQGQIDMHRQLLNRLSSQQKIEEERMELASASFRRDSGLFQKRTIPEDEFEKSKSTWLNEKKNLESIQTEWVSTKSDTYELEQEKASLQLEHDNQLKEYKTSLTSALDLLKNSIEEWYTNFVLVSPIEGTASFNKVWALNQNITEGETLLTVVPLLPSEIVGKACIPAEGAGKVKTGQRVNIKLSNYPYMEYGMIIGAVSRIAPVPVNNCYAVDIELPQKLITNYGKTLGMQQELAGNCEIITDDLRLIQRIIYPIKAVIEKNRR